MHTLVFYGPLDPQLMHPLTTGCGTPQRPSPIVNKACGMHPRIQDRFDPTLECIRRHDAGESSPLGETLGRYSGFFGLFGSFTDYVDSSHLQDLVREDGTIASSTTSTTSVGSRCRRVFPPT